MRLARIDHGHRLRERLILGLIRIASRRRVPDVVRTLLYRRDFWGDPYNDLIHAVMRGPSEWSIGERELIAAVVSKEVDCVF